MDVPHADYMSLNHPLQVQLPSPSDVLRLEPNYPLAGSLPCRGLIATAAVKAPDSKSQAEPGLAQGIPEGVDIISRFFAPQCGQNEVSGVDCCKSLSAPIEEAGAVTGRRFPIRGGTYAGVFSS